MKKVFFVPVDEIIGFAETASENSLKAFVIGTTFNEVVFRIEYNPIKEKRAMIDLESSLNKGYSVDYTDE